MRYTLWHNRKIVFTSNSAKAVVDFIGERQLGFVVERGRGKYISRGMLYKLANSDTL